MRPQRLSLVARTRGSRGTRKETRLPPDIAENAESVGELLPPDDARVNRAVYVYEEPTDDEGRALCVGEPKVTVALLGRKKGWLHKVTKKQ